MSDASIRKSTALAVLIAACGVSSVASAEELKRFPMDESMVQRLKVAYPNAAKSFLDGEERLKRGDFAKAAELFGKAAAEVPKNGLAHRRQCQALVELGRRKEALAACRQALEISATPMDQRATVAALMLGSGPVPASELSEAIRLAGFAKERLHDQPWGFAADCDIARRLGDEAAYKTCLDNLERVVPGHYETKRAAALAPRPRPWVRWLGWAFVGASIAVTLGHSARRRFRALARPAARAAPTLLLLSLLSPRDALAQAAQAPSSPAAATTPPSGEAPWQLSRWRINVNDPESSVPTPAERDTNPLEFGYHLQDLAAEGKKAENEGDYRLAVKYWRAIAKAVPDSNAGFFRACGAYEKLHEREKAIEFCGKGLTLPPEYHPSEASRYAKLVLAKEGKLSDLEIKALDQVTAHLRGSKRPLAAYYAEQIQCDLALELGDEARLSNCTSNLVKLAPDDPRTISYGWTLAVRRQDLSGAEAAIEHARKAKMDPQAIAVLERGLTLAKSERRSRWIRIGFGIAGGAVVLAAAVVFFRRFIARRRAARGLAGAPLAETTLPQAGESPASS